MAEMARNSARRINKSPNTGSGLSGGSRPTITLPLRQLGVGQSMKFPIEMYASVRAVVSKIRVERTRERWNARIDINRDTLQVSVTRLR